VTLARRLLAHRRLAVLLCTAALLMKLVVPTGFMVGDHHGRLSIEVCSGVAPVAMAMPGHPAPRDHGKAEQPCAFAGLSAAALGAVDPVLLAGLIAFVMAAWRVAVSRPAPRVRAWLRPPLRGPPATF
jgi:hypothetical protein